MTHMDPGSAFLAMVPMARTLNLVVEEASPGRAVLRMPDQSEFHNHVGGPHMGAMFTLAESATGVVIVATFRDLLDRAVPLATSVTGDFRKLAMGEVRATASLLSDPDAVRAELADGVRPRFDVSADVTRANGDVVCSFVVTWTLRPGQA